MKNNAINFKKYMLSSICEFNQDNISNTDSFNNINYLDTGNITENNINTIVTYNIKNAPSRAKRKVKDKTIIYSTVRPIQKHYGILHNPASNLIV